MTSKLRLLALSVVALDGLAMAGCGGSNESAQPPSAPTESTAAAANAGANDNLFVSNGVEVLGRSSAAFASSDVHSFTGETKFSFQLGTEKFSETSTFASEDPDRFYMEMKLDGGEEFSLIPLGDAGTVKMLARDGTFYMNLFGGWMSISPEDLGAGQAKIDKVMDSGSIFDYSSFVKDSTNVGYIGDEDVNGHATARYKFEGTVDELVSAFSDAVGGGSSVEEKLSTDASNMPVTVDIWIGKGRLPAVQAGDDGQREHGGRPHGADGRGDVR